MGRRVSTALDQHGLPLFADEPPAGDYRPLFAVNQRVGACRDTSWRGVVVQVAKDRQTGRNHFWVVWTIGPTGGPHAYTAAALRALPEPSADQRRTERQAKQLAAGLHPLSAALGWPLRLHPDGAPAGHREAPGLRCGGCAFRRPIAHRARTYAKCHHGDGTRITHGPGTDVRAWWPACLDYQDGAP
ncbi:hypothetical protein [Prauserella flavalba]|uniref:hypothetical protein n=1 Tax=Prauserella flavalba TaxID=1477506 RepID=UPI0036E74F0A